MEKEFIITSTNTIEGGKVIRYYGVINNNVVLGTNLFSDIGASFIDIFGGTSSSYQNKLKNIYDTSIQNLKVKARNLGANAILGLSIDFDEISGGKKSMFMISVSGTAVLVHYSSDKVENNIKFNESISNDLLVNELTKKQIIIKTQKDKLLSQQEWYFIQQNPIIDISENLLKIFLNNYGYLIPIDSEDGKILLSNVTNYFRVLENETSINVLYDKILENPIHIYNLLNTNNLFSPEKVLWLIENGEIGIAIICLTTNKENYSTKDLSQMSEIIEHIENIANKGNIKASKSLLGKDKEKYICPSGHSNNIESEYCETYNCSLNIKGLTIKQVEQINNFKIKVETLSDLLKPKLEVGNNV